MGEGGSAEVSAFVPYGFHGGLVGEVAVERPPATAGLASADVNLSEMAERALHYLINNPRKGLDWECRFSLQPLNYPPAPEGHDPITLGDTDCRMDWEFMYMREMCGSDEGREVERGLRARILSYVRDDGLSWTPMHHYCIPDLKDFEPAVSLWATQKTMMSLAETYSRTGEAQAKALARKIFLGLRGLASWEGKRAYFEGGSGPWRNGKWIDSFITVMHPSTVQPLVRYWECTGDEEALEFAIALTEGMLAELQSNLGDNRILGDGSLLGHVHAQGHAVWGVAHLGCVTGERRYLDWSKRVLDFLLEQQATDYGWVPEWIVERRDGVAINTGRSEVCAISDVVSIAAWLARAGYSELWDWVERCLRNYLREMQFRLREDYVEEYRGLHGAKAEEGLRVMRELQGGFVAATTPNSWLDRKDHMEMMGCCPPEGMRALHTAWLNAITDTPGGVFVNLSFNRETDAARVTSMLPKEGRLVVVAKRAGIFFVRPPAWAGPQGGERLEPASRVRAYRDGREVPVEWRRDHVAFSAVSAGEELTVTYPLIRFTQRVGINVGQYDFRWTGERFVRGAKGRPRRDEYTVSWLGNTVTAIEPRAGALPIFTGDSDGGG